MSELMTLRAIEETIYDIDPHFWRRYPDLLDRVARALLERFGPRPEIL